MKVYFVRHGESEFNAQHRVQFPTTPLSELGQQQAKAVAARFQHIPIDVILASPMTRAKHTAEIIAATVNQPVQLMVELEEIHRPTELQGLSFQDPIVKKYRQTLDENLDDDWRYSDDESFNDTKARGLRFLRQLQQRGEEHVLVVMHGIMMVYVIALMMFGEELDKKTFSKIIRFTHMSNTGITICEWENNVWQLRILNDAAHLG